MPPWTQVCGMAAILLLAVASELGSENVTLATYYPAPSGVYARMITTGNTLLARDTGLVGIGTTNPQAQLHVMNPSGGGTTVIVEGNGIQGQIYNDGNLHVESTMINGDSTHPLWINQNSGNNVLIAAGTGPGSPRGSVGIGTNNPQGPAPNGLPGNLDANDVYLRNSNQWASDIMGTVSGSLSGQCWVSPDFASIIYSVTTCQCNNNTRIMLPSFDMTAYFYTIAPFITPLSVLSQGWCGVDNQGQLNDVPGNGVRAWCANSMILSILWGIPGLSMGKFECFR